MEKQKARFDLGFGEAVCVRETLANFYNPHMGMHHEILSIIDMGYPSTHAGQPELIESARNLIFSQTGLDYKNVVITQGAGHAINVILGAFRNTSFERVVKYHSPYFAHYPRFIAQAGYEPWMPNKKYEDFIYLIDSPSNPEGVIRDYTEMSSITIWDGTYSNYVYSKLPMIHPKHDVMVGSFGKLFGINGVRLGWIATNNDFVANKLAEYTYVNTLGISLPSQRLVDNIIDSINIESFTKEAGLQVDCNREEIAKLEYLTDFNDIVPVNGMFYWGRMNNKAQELLRRASVHWISGDTCGTTAEHVRLNLAQNRKLTKDMVKMVLRLDGKR